MFAPGVSPTSLDFITMKSKYQVMVYDEAQTVKPADIPSSVMKTKLAARLPLNASLQLSLLGALQ
jgi:hypothetical protein